MRCIDTGDVGCSTENVIHLSVILPRCFSCVGHTGHQQAHERYLPNLQTNYTDQSHPLEASMRRSNPGRGEISRTRSDRLWGPATLL